MSGKSASISKERKPVIMSPFHELHGVSLQIAHLTLVGYSRRGVIRISKYICNDMGPTLAKREGISLSGCQSNPLASHLNKLIPNIGVLGMFLLIINTNYLTISMHMICYILRKKNPLNDPKIPITVQVLVGPSTFAITAILHDDTA